MWKRIIAMALALLALGQIKPWGREATDYGREVRPMAAKTTIWTGATDGDWDENAGANWSNGIPAYIASPGPYDTVIHSTTAINPMSANLDRSGDGAGAGLHLELFEVHENVRDHIGASGGELKLTAEKIVHRGQGFLYLVAKTGTDAEKIDRIIIDSQGGAFLSDTGVAEYVASEYLAGDIETTINVGNDFIHLAQSKVWNVPLNVDIDGTVGPTLLATNAGTVTYSSTGPLVVLDNGGGVFIYESVGADLLTMYQSGGVFYFDGTGSISSAVYLKGGVFDSTRTPGTKSVGSLVRWSEASFIVNDDFFTKSTERIIGEN